MSADFFSVAIQRVLPLEGGYNNDVNDPGGETNFGISKREYPNVDIRALTRDKAIAIYRADFWMTVHGDELAPAVAFQALDFAVNSGPGVAIRKLQLAVGVADDGQVGPVTLSALAHAHPTQVVIQLIAARLDYMRALKNWQSAGRGWAGRIAADLRFAAADLST